jgi:hypothetical protein
MIGFASLFYVAIFVMECRGFVISSSSQGRGTSQMYASTVSKATLTEETTWRLRFSLTGVPTKFDRKVGELFSVDVQFKEDEGFEPPQGTVVQVQTSNDESSSSSRINALKIKGGRWKLSEDPNDRKDGLWVWGLFSEPLYPFMLLNIETEEYSLTPRSTRKIQNDDEDDNKTLEDSILPLKIYAQINHKRDRKTGDVTLEPATLTIRKMETVKADILGVASIELYDEIQVGQLSLRPLNEASRNARDALL